jgi:phosphate transport system substrate-binding protein
MKMRIWVLAVAAASVWNTASASELVVVGTGDGMEMLQAVAAVYTADEPKTAVIVPPSIGSGGAVAAVGADRNVLGRVARPLSDKEKAQGLIDVPFMRIPSAIYVHRTAGVEELTTEQLAAIYSGSIQNWKEVGGNDIRIKVVRREEADSTLGVLRATMPGWKELVFTQRSKLATTTQEAVTTVKDVEGAIGFGPYSRALEAITTILKIDGKHPLDDGYPSAVTLALLYKEGALTPEAAAFVQYVRSPKAHRILSSWGGVPIKD